MMAISLGFPNGLATDYMSPHLILVGISGAGKTTIGTTVATRLGRVSERRSGS
jgi:adenylylsulfate kinase-like enzyme